MRWSIIDFENNFRKITVQIAYLIIPIEKRNKNNIEIISYGICALLTSILNIILSAITLFFFHKINDYLLFLIFFIPIRCLHKGFHCKKLLNCLVLTNILFTLSVLTCSALKFLKYLYAIFFIVLILHFLFSNEKNTLLHFSLCILYIFIYFFISEIQIYLIVSLILDLILIEGEKINEKIITK